MDTPLPPQEQRTLAERLGTEVPGTPLDWITLTPAPHHHVQHLCAAHLHARKGSAETWGEFTVGLNCGLSGASGRTLAHARQIGTPRSPARRAALNLALLRARAEDARRVLWALDTLIQRHTRTPVAYSSAGVLLVCLNAEGQYRVTLSDLGVWNLGERTLEGGDPGALRDRVSAQLVAAGVRFSDPRLPYRPGDALYP